MAGPARTQSQPAYSVLAIREPSASSATEAATQKGRIASARSVNVFASSGKSFTGSGSRAIFGISRGGLTLATSLPSLARRTLTRAPGIRVRSDSGMVPRSKLGHVRDNVRVCQETAVRAGGQAIGPLGREGSRQLVGLALVD